MGKTKNNKYTQFVREVILPRLQAEQPGKKITLAEACVSGQPFWEELSDLDKKHWRQRAKEYAQTDEFRKEVELKMRVRQKLVSDRTKAGRSPPKLRRKQKKGKKREEEEDCGGYSSGSCSGWESDETAKTGGCELSDWELEALCLVEKEK